MAWASSSCSCRRFDNDGAWNLARYETGFLSSQPQLFYQVWHPSDAVKGRVLIVHGLGGHGGQFSFPAQQWANSGFAVYTMDLRGHGRSEGPQAYIHAWDDYLQDFNHIVEYSQAEYPSLPMALWGHSLGGLIALDVALRFSEIFSCLLVSAPAVGKTGVSPGLFLLGQLLSWVWPKFGLELGFDPRACSRNPDVVKSYNADPLRHSRGTARLSTEFNKAQIRIFASLAQLKIPTLILHGGGDRITNPQDSVKLYQTLSGGQHKLIQYPHAFHELHLDINRDEVLADMSYWIQTHCTLSSN